VAVIESFYFLYVYVAAHFVCCTDLICIYPYYYLEGGLCNVIRELIQQCMVPLNLCSCNMVSACMVFSCSTILSYIASSFMRLNKDLYHVAVLGNRHNSVCTHG